MLYKTHPNLILLLLVTKPVNKGSYFTKYIALVKILNLLHLITSLDMVRTATDTE